MPYRLAPRDKRVVQVLRNGKWVTLKRHTDRSSAKRHLIALRINVKEA